jgi:hypothetical protein
MCFATILTYRRTSRCSAVTRRPVPLRRERSTRSSRALALPLRAAAPHPIGSRSPTRKAFAKFLDAPVSSILRSLHTMSSLEAAIFRAWWRFAGKRVVHGERLLTIGGHLRRPSRTARDWIPLAATMLLDDARTPFGVAPRLPWRWLRHDGQKAEAQETTEPLHPRVILPAAPPLGGADTEPDLVAGGCAINGLKHQFERDPLLLGVAGLKDWSIQALPLLMSDAGNAQGKSSIVRGRGNFDLPAMSASDLGSDVEA